MSANQQRVLERGIYADNNIPMTVTLNNLTVDSNYLVQVWVNDSRFGTMAGRTENATKAGGNSVTLTYNNTVTKRRGFM